jgi:hypothetical protein
MVHPEGNRTILFMEFTSSLVRLVEVLKVTFGRVRIEIPHLAATKRYKEEKRVKEKQRTEEERKPPFCNAIRLMLDLNQLV